MPRSLQPLEDLSVYEGWRNDLNQQDFPSGANYKVCTQVDVDAMKKSKSKSKSITVVMPVIKDNEDSTDSSEGLESSTSIQHSISPAQVVSSELLHLPAFYSRLIHPTGQSRPRSAGLTVITNSVPTGPRSNLPSFRQGPRKRLRLASEDDACPLTSPRMFPPSEPTAPRTHRHPETNCHGSGTSYSQHNKPRAPPSEPQLYRRLADVEAEVRRLLTVQEHLGKQLQAVQEACPGQTQTPDS
ncbi:hypothetical protein C8R44DRAFT_869848 [Mycena epipterygia]|nr:hypothetical protein C8R44DRAFT_869848 [Mycena epipterygia]